VVGRKHLSLREQASAAERQRVREELQALTERYRKPNEERDRRTSAKWAEAMRR
jgi:hypothetical protein